MEPKKIVEMSNYKKKRKKFMEEVKIKDEIQPINIEREREVEKEKKKPIEMQKYKAKKSARRNSTEEQRRKARKELCKEIRNIMAAITFTTLVAGTVGAVIGEKAYEKCERDRNAVTLEQALEAGKNLEDLSLQEDLVKVLKEMNQTIEQEDMTYKELLEVAQELPGLKQIFLKDKIVEAVKINRKDDIDFEMNPSGLGTGTQIQRDDIDFETDPSGKGICIEVPKRGITYRRNNVINQINGCRTYSSDILEYIEEITEAKRMKVAIETKEFEMEGAKEYYEEAIEKLNKQVTWKVITDERGNLEVEKMNQLELEKENDDDLER